MNTPPESDVIAFRNFTENPLVEATHVRFEYGDYNLEVPAPAQGDQITLDYRYLTLMTINKDFTGFRDDSFRKIRTINCNFDLLDCENRLIWLQFIEDTMGKWIKYTDYHSAVWSALIMNPGDLLNSASADESGVYPLIMRLKPWPPS